MIDSKDESRFQYRSVYAGVLVLAFAAALWPRYQGYDAVPLWLDEAWRANLALDDGWPTRPLDGSVSSAISSPIYLYLIHALGLIYKSDWVLRLSSLLPGLAAVLLLVPIVRLATGSLILGFFAALAAALNPTLISFSNELKPYSFELSMHLFMIWLALSYLARLRKNAPVGTVYDILILIAGPVATLSAANLVFLLPGWYLAIVYAQYRFRRRIHWPTLASGAVTGGLLLFQYKYIWSIAPNSSGLVQFWAQSFHDQSTYFPVWLLDKIHEIVQAALFTHQSAPPWLSTIFKIAAPIFVGIGVIGAVVSRRFEHLQLFVTPIVLVIAANAAKVWPLGPIRVDIFLYGYFIILAFLGCGYVINSAKSEPYRAMISTAVYAVLALWFVVFSFPRDVKYFATQHPPQQDVPGALKELWNEVSTRCKEKPLVLINTAASHAVSYYTRHNAVTRPLASRLKDCVAFEVTAEAYSSPDIVAHQLKDYFSTRKTIWFLYSHIQGNEISILVEIASRFGRVTGRRDLMGAGIFAVTATTDDR